MITLRTSLALPILATLCWGWLPQDPQREPEVPTHEDQDPVVRVQAEQTGFVLREGDIGVELLVAKAATFLGVNIMFDPTALSSTNPVPITLTKAIETDVNGCWDLLTQLLWTRGLVVTQVDERLGVWEVLAVSGPRRADVMQRAQFVDVDRLPRFAHRMVPILTAVALENIHATVATNALRPFFAQFASPGVGSLQIGNTGDQTGMILMGFGPNVHEAWLLLQKIDRPPMDPRRLESRLDAVEARLAAVEKVGGSDK